MCSFLPVTHFYLTLSLMLFYLWAWFPTGVSSLWVGKGSSVSSLEVFGVGRKLCVAEGWKAQQPQALEETVAFIQACQSFNITVVTVAVVVTFSLSLACLFVSLGGLFFPQPTCRNLPYPVRRGTQTQTRRVLIPLIESWHLLSKWKLTLLNSNHVPGGDSRLFLYLATGQWPNFGLLDRQ